MNKKKRIILSIGALVIIGAFAYPKISDHFTTKRDYDRGYKLDDTDGVFLDNSDDYSYVNDYGDFYHRTVLETVNERDYFYYFSKYHRNPTYVEFFMNKDSDTVYEATGERSTIFSLNGISYITDSKFDVEIARKNVTTNKVEKFNVSNLLKDINSNLPENAIITDAGLIKSSDNQGYFYVKTSRVLTLDELDVYVSNINNDSEYELPPIYDREGEYSFSYFFNLDLAFEKSFTNILDTKLNSDEFYKLPEVSVDSAYSDDFDLFDYRGDFAISKMTDVEPFNGLYILKCELDQYGKPIYSAYIAHKNSFDRPHIAERFPKGMELSDKYNKKFDKAEGSSVFSIMFKEGIDVRFANNTSLTDILSYLGVDENTNLSNVYIKKTDEYKSFESLHELAIYLKEISN